MIITNANAFINGKFEPNSDLVLKDGKITAIGKGLQMQGEEIKDVNGDYILPGFVDIHIHSYMGEDTMRGEESIRKMSRALKKHGVCAFLPTTMSASIADTKSALADIDAVMKNQEPDGAIVLGAHVEGPFLCKNKAGAQMKEHFIMPTIENWEAITGEYAHVVRVITLAPELDAMPLIAHLKNLGVHVSIGHTSATAQIIHEAGKVGADHITHTFNAQTPLNHREPGVPGAALVDDAFYCEVIGDGVHLHGDIVKLILRCKGKEKYIAITDAMEAAGMPDGKYSLGGQDVFVKDGAARLADGTLAGSTLTMKDSFTNLITRFGATPEQAATVTTITPAKSIDEEEVGRIELNSPAILARFDKDFMFVESIG